MSLKWITLQVKNLEESIKFYNNILGLPVASKFDAGIHKIAMMGKKESPKIELIEQVDRMLKNFGEGVSIGIGVEDLDEEISRLKNLNIEASEIISPMKNIRFCFIKDPNNYTIQLVEEK